jgi:DNA-binding response OmpR family regulator
MSFFVYLSENKRNPHTPIEVFGFLFRVFITRTAITAKTTPSKPAVRSVTSTNLEVVSWLKGHSVALMLLDLMLSGCGGTDICSHIKKLRKKIHLASPDHEMIHSLYDVGYKFEPSATK